MLIKIKILILKLFQQFKVYYIDSQEEKKWALPEAYKFMLEAEKLFWTLFTGIRIKGCFSAVFLDAVDDTKLIS